jgi:hypothetical protein
VFGEDALVNVSVEKLPDGRLGGYLRIRWAGKECLGWAAHTVCYRCSWLCPAALKCPLPRLACPLPHHTAHLSLRRSKTQGIALSLGDKLILKQKGA